MMKKFGVWEVEEAWKHAEDGGQALHIHNIIVDYDKAPSCFVREVESGRMIAHLFDKDRERLEKTARRLGVRVILVERPGKKGQHIDLCGGPLRKAIAECDQDRQGELF